MGKSVGFIGNFKGKLGNAVGYKVSQSNSGTNQGIRVYQPNIKNPKSAAQAEQRAKYAPIFATYNALKSIIDRGNESKPYGNASRIAWLKKAFRASEMPWIVKGGAVAFPVVCQLTKGSLPRITFSVIEDKMNISCPELEASASVTTVGGVSTALMAGYPFLKAGDQITVVLIGNYYNALNPTVFSFVLDTTSTIAISGFKAAAGSLTIEDTVSFFAGAVIVSREGANGEHLRSTTLLAIDPSYLAEYPYVADSKAAAIESYMSSASANADWAEESIQ